MVADGERAKNECPGEDAKGADANKVEELLETRTAVDAFLANRCEESYEKVLSEFVLEVMSTERCAAFPTSSEILTTFLADKGPFSSAIVRDGAGRPYLVFLTGSDRENNKAEAVASMKASAMFINVMKDPALAGVAIDPWNEGGVALPKNLLVKEFGKIHGMFASERRAHWRGRH